MAAKNTRQQKVPVRLHLLPTLVHPGWPRQLQRSRAGLL